jgi:hypothetical protein
MIMPPEDDDSRSDAVENFLHGLHLPEPASTYVHFFLKDGISTENDLDLIARSSEKIFKDFVLEELKNYHKPTWFTIMGAFYKRKQSRNLD